MTGGDIRSYLLSCAELDMSGYGSPPWREGGARWIQWYSERLDVAFWWKRVLNMPFQMSSPTFEDFPDLVDATGHATNDPYSPHNWQPEEVEEPEQWEILGVSSHEGGGKDEEDKGCALDGLNDVEGQHMFTK